MSDYIDINIKEGVLCITLNRPDKKNALDTQMYQALADAFTDADKNPDVRVAYLTSSSDAFCSGNDLQDFLENPPADMNAPVFQFIQAIANAKKPVIAAVSGLAVGIGTTMLLHCDLVYADETARFMLPFVQLGVCAEAGSSLLLPRLFGYQRAAELLLAGESFGAQEAQQSGLVSRTLASDSLQEYAWQKAQMMVKQPCNALMATKRLMKNPLEGQIDKAIRQESEEFIKLLNEDEARQIMRSFFKRHGTSE